MRRAFLHVVVALTAVVVIPEAVSGVDPAPNLFTVDVAGGGTGSGAVRSNLDTLGSGEPLSCTVQAGSASGDCRGSFETAAGVTLQATPSPGSTFVRWGGDASGCGTNSSCVVTRSLAPLPGRLVEVTATFNVIAVSGRLLTVKTAGSGTGSVSSAPPGISCTLTSGEQGGDCQETYPNGTTVLLTATAGAGTVFVGWSGACSGTATCSVTLAQSATVSATFAQQLSLTVGVTGPGTVTSAPAGISCPTACSSPFANGTTVTLTAIPAAGATFSGWSGDCTGSGTCTVQVNGTRSVTARFTGAATPAGPVEAQLVAVRVRTTGLGRRVVLVEISTDERVSAELALRRSGTTLADRRIRRIRPGIRLLTLVVPDSVRAGRARLVIELENRSGAEKTFRRRVTLPPPG